MSGRLFGETIIIAPGANTGAPGAQAIGHDARQDMEDGGVFMISDALTVDGAPSARKVRLFESSSGRLVRETWSNAQGEYTITQIKDGEYDVAGYDHTGAFDPAMKSKVKPEPMP